MALILLIVLLVNLTPVQNYIVDQATKSLSDRLKTKVEIDHIRIDPLNHLYVQGIYVEGQDKDTLLYAGEIRFRITDWFIFRKGIPVIKYIGLHDTYVNLYRTARSDEWNYQFIIDAFGSSPDTTTKKSGGTIDIDLKEVDLKNVRFDMNDAWVGSDMNFAVGSFSINADKVDLSNKIIEVDNIAATATKVILRDYDGGRPPKPAKPRSNIIDTTAFNPGNWKLKLSDLNLKDCYFCLDVGTRPAYQNEFDANHIHVSGIQLDAEKILIQGDTLTVELNNLAAKERSGLAIKKMKAEIRVSPNESICKNLLLQTPNSIIEDYYAMHYTRFPDFLDYINKVVMVANFKKSKVDSKDIAYFATVLREYPTVIHISGDVKGTVADIKANKLNLTDGYSTVKGNLSMKGLPDIESTYINYTEGELFTSGDGLFKYAPELKNNESVAIGSITHAYFKGDFKGYINNFVINGTITSNLGNIVSDVSMKIPDDNKTQTTFAGNVKVNDLNLGMLLREPDLGTITLTADVDGTESRTEGVAVNFKTIIDHIEYRKYSYQGINADGKLEKEKFTGNLLISDPNLSLGFYGLFDFSDKLLKINATANVLQSNLKELNLVQEDMTLVADFDMDWTGNNIDDFTGFAKVYNIDLTKKGHLLDLDSIYVKATETGTSKKLAIASNAFSAVLEGQYRLSSLPNSFQYYIAGYLPNYISVPSEPMQEQDITFELKTNELDSLFAMFLPNVSGFNNTTVLGVLSTSEQQLKLNAHIDAGKISGIQINTADITAQGNYRTLAVTADVGNISFTDTSLNGSFELNTTLGNDKLTFSLITKSRNALGEAVIKGQAIAHGDTLDASFFPSEFYLNKKKWDITGGNKIVFTDGYLAINNLFVKSGNQQIGIHSNNNGLQQRIGINISGLNVSEIGDLAGLSDYKIKGTINGNIQVNNLFSEMYVSSEIKALGLKFGKDTIGNVDIAGSYDDTKELLTLDDRTGIYWDDKSLTASGKFSFATNVKQNIDAQVNLNKTPLSWLSPILHGFVSDINGTLDGKVTIKGTSDVPDIKGKVNLDEVSMHIDFLGSVYRIPEASININNRSINVGKMTLYDRFDNTALLTGGIDHDRFKKMKLDFRMTSSKFEVIDLKPNESELFYGNLIAKFESLNITGPFDDVKVAINKAQPAQKSHLYLPLSTGSNEIGAYSYITFKKTGEEVEEIKKNNDKLTIEIEAILNPLAEITMIMDPATGDAINASGTGNISMAIPPNNEIRMFGNYTIESGSYTFTLPQLFFKRKFALNSGSLIQFQGPIDNTQLNVDGIYTTRARLYDLLSANEKTIIEGLDKREVDQAKLMRNIDVILTMGGSLGTPELEFKLESQDKTGAGTIAYKKLERVNNDERELFNQVASLLLINAFMPAEGGFEGGAASGVVNNVSDIFSGTASSQLTNLLAKLTGDENIAIDLKYQKYSFDNNDPGASNRNALSLGVKKNLFKDRLTVEVGSSVDWGKPTSSNNTSNFNPVGDFRMQYLLKEGGNLRGNIFRTSSYDVLADQNITRGGVGLSYRKSFNNLQDLFGGAKYMRKEEEAKIRSEEETDNTDSTQNGTN